ncbi:MAG: hypothetical protein MUF31_12445 [Akkermansiaceae bacterium]|jgi:cytochrome c peroxidase|nr:hypothetical protein [Akkermansiaceae bacterium]
MSWIARISLCLTLLGGHAGASDAAAEARARGLAAVGKEIFHDLSLSHPVGQGCVSCHQPALAFSDPRPVSPGAVAGRQGTRNAPTLMYAALIPSLDQEDFIEPDGVVLWLWEGGMFHDGRARTLHEQVAMPFFDHAEMNLADEAALAAKLRQTSYFDRLSALVDPADAGDSDPLVHAARRALVEFLKEPLFRPFDSRLDDFLGGDATALTASETRGLELFRGKAKCADCHFLTATSWPKPLLSDYGYDNLGLPSRGGKKDPGLGGHTGHPEEMGQFKSPTLRNIALTAPYFHDGSMATLREVLEFYNERDVEPRRWGPTDFPETVNRDDFGNLGLTAAEIDDLLALMDAFTDRSLLRMRESGTSLPEAPAGTPDAWSMRAYFPDWNHRATPVKPMPRAQPPR